MKRKSPHDWLKEIPGWEQELYAEARDAARHERTDAPVPHTPGDWMPYGRIPYDLIPDPDLGPGGWWNPHGASDNRDKGESLRRWHKLRKAGLA